MAIGVPANGNVNSGLKFAYKRLGGRSDCCNLSFRKRFAPGTIRNSNAGTIRASIPGSGTGFDLCFDRMVETAPPLGRSRHADPHLLFHNFYCLIRDGAHSVRALPQNSG